MANLRNFTPHVINLIKKEDLVGLTQVNATTWVAEGFVEGGAPYLTIESEGEIRIDVTTVTREAVRVVNYNIPAVNTKYGAISGLPFLVAPEDLLIVSLPTQTNAAAAGLDIVDKLVTPFKVVRMKSNTSVILGALGVSFLAEEEE